MTTDFSQRHLGSGMVNTPELLVRQLLLEGLVLLAADEYRLDELFAREDELLQGTQAEWVEDFKARIREMAKLNHLGSIEIGVGYPDLDTRMPYISIANEAGREDESQAVMGDVLGASTHKKGPAIPTGSDPSDPAVREVLDQITMERRTVIGNEWQTTIQVGAWVEVPEESLLLHAVNKHLLFHHKADLEAAGVREIALSETGFEPADEMRQRTGYVPITRCTMRWAWRQTRRRNAPFYFTLSLPTKTNQPL